MEGHDRQLRFSGSVAYLDFEWQQLPAASPTTTRCSPAAPSNTDYAGHTNQLAPKITGYLSAEYSWQLKGDRAAGHDRRCWRHSAKFLQSLNLDPAAVQKAYTKLNARVALGGAEGRWEVALVGRNLTDKTTMSYAGDTPLAFRLFRARSYYGFVDPPRSIAIEARMNF